MQVAIQQARQAVACQRDLRAFDRCSGHRIRGVRTRRDRDGGIVVGMCVSDSLRRLNDSSCRLSAVVVLASAVHEIRVHLSDRGRHSKTNGVDYSLTSNRSDCHGAGFCTRLATASGKCKFHSRASSRCCRRCRAVGRSRSLCAGMKVWSDCQSVCRPTPRRIERWYKSRATPIVCAPMSSYLSSGAGSRPRLVLGGGSGGASRVRD
jgi:hypothetical protein